MRLRKAELAALAPSRDISLLKQKSTVPVDSLEVSKAVIRRFCGFQLINYEELKFKHVAECAASQPGAEGIWKIAWLALIALISTGLER